MRTLLTRRQSLTWIHSNDVIITESVVIGSVEKGGS